MQQALTTLFPQKELFNLIYQPPLNQIDYEKISFDDG